MLERAMIVAVVQICELASPRQSSRCSPEGWGGGDSAYERVGMLVVSLRGVNFGF